MNSDMNNMGSMFDQVQSEGIAKWKQTTPEQLIDENRALQAQRKYEALHTDVEVCEEND
jgi:hypothetical protein